MYTNVKLENSKTEIVHDLYKYINKAVTNTMILNPVNLFVDVNTQKCFEIP